MPSIKNSPSACWSRWAIAPTSPRMDSKPSKRLRASPYDVILMDVQMPEMDGLDATRKIRMIQTVAQPRIVAMTANAMQGDRELCLAAGMDDYISKPIRANELVESLMRAGSHA
jgi:CheY-like chemotaxis protein